MWGAGRRRGLSSLVLPLRFAEPTTLDFLANTEWGFIVPYKLSVSEGYWSDLPPDPTEGNDFCNQAAELPIDGTELAVNFDTPGDFDWFEITVPGEAPDFETSTAGETEPNNTRGEAEVVQAGDRIVGGKPFAADVDFYAIDLESGDLLDVDVWSTLLKNPPPGFTEFSMRFGLVDAGEIPGF